MTTEELNTKLYQKMEKEMEDFKNELRAFTPDEIMGRAYELAIKEDILYHMEYNDLTDEQAKTLLKDKKPLDSVYQKWEHMDTHYMDLIGDAVEARADELIQMKKREQPEIGK